MSWLMDTVTRNEALKVADASGCYLYTKDNQMYIDWFMDCGVTSLGYRPVRLISKIADYCMPHIPNTAYFELRENTAYMLCDYVAADMSKTFFCNSGTEAVEAAIKVIRKWNHDNGTGRKVIYTARHGFHGRTLGSLAAGDSAEYHYKGFEPLPSGFLVFEEPNEINWDHAAGLLLEPIAGNNDVRERPWLEEVCLEALRHEVPIAFDEIQSGAFRTGCFTASELYGIEPDIICLGKGIACGIPTGVTLVNSKLSTTITPGTHYSTFGGSPMSMLGIQILLTEPNLNVTVNYASSKLKKRLSRLDGVKEVRGRGLMLAMEFDKDLDARDFSAELFRQNMFVPTFRKNVMKIAPPLNISDTDCNNGLRVMERAFLAATKAKRGEAWS